MDVDHSIEREVEGEVEELSLTERHELEDVEDDRVDEAMEDLRDEDSTVSGVTVTRKTSELDELEPGDYFINSAKEKFRKTEDGFEEVEE